MPTITGLEPSTQEIGRPPDILRERRHAPEPYVAAEFTPHQPSRFESAAQEILLKIWHWIIVGEEHRPVGVSMEFSIASTWLLRLGVLILVMGMGFFLKYSIDHDYIGPLGRVGLSILAGVGMLAFGTQLLGKKSSHARAWDDRRPASPRFTSPPSRPSTSTTSSMPAWPLP